jgi:6-pyruvoyltetrahydropterin/6-carboxytetrahydropterin synthase
VLEVSVRGPIDPASGRVADVAALDRLVSDHVLRVLDHKNLNVEVPEFATAVPTTENLAFAIRDRMEGSWAAAFPGPWPRLERIRIQETKRNTFEIRNEE